MRTSLILDDDIATLLRAEARRTGRALETLVNDYLRLALARGRDVRPSPRVELERVDLGGPLPGYGYDNIADMLEAAEGPRHR